MAALIPLPETSPTTTSRLPSGFERGLEEIAADGLRGMVFGFDGEGRRVKCFGHQHALL